jgi:predicted MFS family arabinose efflux permease
MALQQVAMTATRIFGPFLAGALVAIPAVGSGGAYLFMAALLTTVCMTMLWLPATKGREKGSGPSALAYFRLGIAHVAGRPRLALLSTAFIGVIVGGFSYQVILPGYLEHELGHKSTDMAWLLGVAGASGLISTVAVAGQAHTKRAWPLMFIGGLVFGAALLLMAIGGSFLQALLIMFLMGAGSSVFQMLNSALVMQESDPAYYGRVMSVTMMAWGLNSLVGLPFGLLADAHGERTALLVMGLVVIGFVVAAGTALQTVNVVSGPRRGPVPAPLGPAPGADGRG